MDNNTLKITVVRHNSTLFALASKGNETAFTEVDNKQVKHVISILWHSGTDRVKKMVEQALIEGDLFINNDYKLVDIDQFPVIKRNMSYLI